MAISQNNWVALGAAAIACSIAAVNAASSVQSVQHHCAEADFAESAKTAAMLKQSIAAEINSSNLSKDELEFMWSWHNQRAQQLDFYSPKEQAERDMRYHMAARLILPDIARAIEKAA